MEAICGSGDFLFNFHDCEPNNEREMQAYQAALAANETAFNALRQALEQPEQSPLDRMAENARTLGLDYEPVQEPVAWRNAALRVGEDLCSVGPFGYYDMTAEQWLDWALSVVTVHAPQPSKPWVGLTDDDLDDIATAAKKGNLYDLRLAIEAKLKEKNT